MSIKAVTKSAPDKPKIGNCSDIPSRPTSGYIPIVTHWAGIGYKEDCLKAYPNGVYTIEPLHNGNSKVTINFDLKNESNTPVDLDTYKFYILANQDVSEREQSIKSGSIIPHTELQGNVISYIDSKYKGPLSLEIVQYHTHKTITVDKY